MTKLASIALALPDVDQGIACAGTALESRTYSVGRKAFLFVSGDSLRLKLDRSIAEARKHSAQVGAGGWTRVSLDALPPVPVLRRWIAESHGLIGGRPTGKKSTAAKGPARKRN